jgi:hypothetical protein
MADPGFDAERQRVFELHHDGLHEAGLALAEEVAERHPGRLAETTFWRACFLSLLGRTDDAFAAFFRALDRGAWWQRGWLEMDPDLEALRSLPRIGDVLAGSDANLEEARTRFPDRPEVRLLLPAGRPRALLLVMHMLGETAAETEPRWRGATDVGAAVAVVGSSQSTSDGVSCWELDDLVVRDLSLARDEARRAGVGDEAPVVLAGASQGGRWAIQLAIDDRLTAAGFLVAATGVPRPGQLEPHLPSAAGRGIRGWILAGERDHATPDAERLGRELAAAGLEVRVEPVAGLGHDYPEDFSRRLAGALDLVLGG